MNYILISLKIHHHYRGHRSEVIILVRVNFPYYDLSRIPPSTLN